MGKDPQAQLASEVSPSNKVQARSSRRLRASATRGRERSSSRVCRRSLASIGNCDLSGSPRYRTRSDGGEQEDIAIIRDSDAVHLEKLRILFMEKTAKSDSRWWQSGWA